MPAIRKRALFGKAKPSPQVHKFSSTQVNISGEPHALVKAIAKRIPKSDLAEDGVEADSHITCKYGLHFQTPSKRLRDAVAAFGPVTMTLGKTSLFENEDADVLKVDVKSHDLHRLNAMITRILPTETTHPVYIPHLTIAYLKPGRGKKYAGDQTLVGQKIHADHIVFSGKKGHVEKLPLTGRAGFRPR